MIEYESNGVEIERVYEGDTLTPIRDEVEGSGTEKEVTYVDGKPTEIEIAVGEAECEAEFKNGRWEIEIEKNGVEYEGFLDDFDGNFDGIDLASLERDDDENDDDEDEEYAGRYDDGDDDD